MYSNTIAQSLDTIELRRLCKRNGIKFASDKLLTYKDTTINRTCCDVLVNVSFDKDYVTYTNCQPYMAFCDDGKFKEIKQKKDETIDKKQLRKHLYINGFDVDGCHYVEYKRSSSKARQGQTLFILDSLYDHMIKWSHLDIDFDEGTYADDGEGTDLCALRAYESLTSSGIENLVKINPSSIVLIEDMHSIFKQKVSNTRFADNGRDIITVDETIDIDNTIWDGQSLLDISLFESIGMSDKGMMLLRNRFFKSCAFNTNIQKYFADNDITDISQINGKTLARKISDIKLITTPSSLKLLKFAYKIDGDCFQYWCKHIDNMFGVVKNEHESKFAEWGVNQLAYQYVNSLPLSETEVQELVKYDLHYLDLLKNNDKFFAYSLGNEQTINTTRGLYANLISANPDFLKTECCKKYRKDYIDLKKDKIKKGKIKLSETDYCVLTSNPYEMLQATIGITDISEQVHPLIGDQVYTNMVGDGVDVCAFRSPHICTGNVYTATNIHCELIDKYFNFSKNIVVLNSIECAVFDRLQGADVDSDQAEISAYKPLVTACKRCKPYLTPVNSITADKQKYTCSRENKAIIDNTLSDNLIGAIVNLSQILNSYYWNSLYNAADSELLNIIYGAISQLSTLSQIEIDRAKKSYSFKSKKVLKELRNLEYNGQPVIQTENILKYKPFKDSTAIDLLVDATRFYYIHYKDCPSLEAVELSHNVKLQERFLQWFAFNYNNTDDNFKHFFRHCVQSTATVIAQVRPTFMKNIQCTQNGFVFKEFQCPMDYLYKAVSENRRQRTNTHTIPMVDLLVCSDRKNNYNKLQVGKLTTMADNLRFVMADNYESQKKYNNLLTAYREVVDKMNINIATMMYILRKIYEDKPAINRSNNFKYRKHRKHILALLGGHIDTIAECIKSVSDGCRYELVQDDTGDMQIYGRMYRLNEIPISDNHYITKNKIA